MEKENCSSMNRNTRNEVEESELNRVTCIWCVILFVSMMMERTDEEEIIKIKNSIVLHMIQKCPYQLSNKRQVFFGNTNTVHIYLPCYSMLSLHTT